MSKSVKLLSSGKLAMETVARILPTASAAVVPSVLGALEMVPGAIWRGNRMLVLVQGPTTYSTIDDRLYEWSTSDFARDEWLGATKEAASSAKGWVVIAHAEMALLCGMFVPWYLMLGMTCAKVGVFYSTNKTTVDQAITVSRRVLPMILDLRSRNPVLFKTLRTSITQRTLAELKRGHGVTADDIAFFLGRLIQGAANAPEMSLRVLLRIFARVAILVTATHAPSIIVHAAYSAADRAADDLQRHLKAAGYTVTVDEASEILREVRNDPNGVYNIKQIETALNALLPFLATLHGAPGL
jgi:hypothetical protein